MADNGYKQITNANWDRSKSIWCIREFETTVSRKDKPSQYEKLTYKSYEANPKMDKSQFRLPALGLRPNARLLYLDFETKAVDSYTNPPAPPEEENDTLMDGLKRLTLRDSILPPQRTKSSHLRRQEGSSQVPFPGGEEPLAVLVQFK